MKSFAFEARPTVGAQRPPRRTVLKKEIFKFLSRGAKILYGKGEKLPVVCVFGHEDFKLETPVMEEYEEKNLDCRCYPSDSELERALISDKPHVIVSVGDAFSFPHLRRAPFEVRKRWLHYDVLPDLAEVGVQVYDSYLRNLFHTPGKEEDPLVSIFTPAYNTGEKIHRAFRSLEEQTYTNWEWILVDDSDDGGETFKNLCHLARKDHRVQVFKSWEHSGVIGKIKKWACSLAKGQILVELDHDDELTEYSLDHIVKGFQQFPEAGFLYTDCAEVLGDGTNVTYRNGWAFGYGSYTDIQYRGTVYKSGSGGNINAKTIRHIISAPNHARAWRKAFYESIGGHNRELHVADDYEIVVRTFLKTRMIRVHGLGYIQHVSNTTQQVRNKDIHRHVRSIRSHYDKMIHERLLELGCEDFIWDEAKGCSDFNMPNPPIESHVTLTAKV